ncbi:MAG: glycosyltransferase family protein [Deferribacteraceae bacterium]|jgi:spore coat polysaccharide biosynthesis protein SpsF|nr:glycosyltransferase family protein [Deferribacteraceae bacterium]
MGLVVIQARLSSSRLAGKVLLPILEKPVIYHVVKRAKAAGVGEVILAIPDNVLDEPLARFAEEIEIGCYKGSEKDVLDRYYRAALPHKPDYVVRLTSDCPCLDSAVIRDTVDFFLTQRADYAASDSRNTFYHGTDTEVFTFDALIEAAECAQKDYQREHVTPYIREKSGFSRCIYDGGIKPDEIIPRIRATLDTKEDYIVIKAIFELLGENFSHSDVVELFKRYTWLSDINSAIMQKKIYQDETEEIAAAAKLLRLQEMKRAAAYLDKLL